MLSFSRQLGGLLLVATLSGTASAGPLGFHWEPEPAGIPQTPAGQAYREGLRKLAEGDQTAAERSFRQALSLAPKNANALLGLAQIEFARQRMDEAGKLIGQAVRNAPDNAHAQASLGRYLALRKDYAGAEAALKKAVQLDGKLIRPEMDLADLYATALRRPEEAVNLYRSVISLDAKHAGAWYAQGIALGKLNRFAEAEKSLEKSFSLEPQNPLPPLALARLALQRKDPDSARRWVDEALALHPTLAEALELRGDIALAQGDRTLALADYSSASRAQPAPPLVSFKLGGLLQQLGRTDEARNAYKEAIRSNPKLAPAYNNLAWIAAAQGKNLAEALSWAKKAVELAPDVPDFRDTLGWVHRAKGELDKAETALLAATRQKGAPASAYYHLGVVLEQRKKPAQAALAYQEALEIDKNHPPAAEALKQLGGR